VAALPDFPGTRQSQQPEDQGEGDRRRPVVPRRWLSGR
jgi:hypothetical protein